jgi:hypothetical protein
MPNFFSSTSTTITNNIPCIYALSHYKCNVPGPAIDSKGLSQTLPLHSIFVDFFSSSMYLISSFLYSANVGQTFVNIAMTAVVQHDQRLKPARFV